MKKSISWLLASAVVPMMAVASHSTEARAQEAYYYPRPLRRSLLAVLLQRLWALPLSEQPVLPRSGRVARLWP
jgi:hypothetical protein